MRTQPLTIASRWAVPGCLLLTILLSACSSGGGGGGVTPPADAPVLSLTPQAVKTFRFTWDDVEGETEYRLLEDPDGSSGYVEVASIDADSESHDHIVFLPARINARYILEACNAGGCAESAPVHVVVETLAEAIGYVKASNTAENHLFGSSVALAADGATLAVGAPREDSDATGIEGIGSNNPALNSGAVYVFTLAGGVWSQQAYIKASNTGAGDLFGWSIALSANGDTLAVGAPSEDSDATGTHELPHGAEDNDDAPNSGAVYVFTRSGGTWTQQAYVKASNTGQNDQFGVSAALSGDGDTLAVGATAEDSDATGVFPDLPHGAEDNDDAPSSGAAYVFTRTGGTWTQQAYVKASNTGQNDQFGISAALSGDGDTLAVGANFEDSDATGVFPDLPHDVENNDDALNGGAVYVFTRTSGAWSQQVYVKASNTSAGDRFGESIALSDDGDVLAVGALQEDSDATGINGDEDNGDAPNSGAVYVFTRDGIAWSQQAFVKASNTGANDRFGHSVTLSADGETLAVGANQEDSNALGINGDEDNDDASTSGAAYVYTRTGNAWSQQAYVKASNTGTNDEFGYSIAISANGDTLAVGARTEAGNATGLDGDQDNDDAIDSGALFLY
jgi:trimeric autotransporter adhesin